MNWMGIDPGLGGGWAIVDDRMRLLDSGVMPKIGKILDIVELNNIIIKASKQDIGLCILENVASRPGQSSVSTFKFGRVFGITEALLMVSPIPYALIPPSKWHKLVVHGDTKLKAKERALLTAKKLFPGETFLATERSKVPHDGIVDAALMAVAASKI